MSLEIVRLSPEQWPLARTIRLSTLATAAQWFSSKLPAAERYDEADWRGWTGDSTHVALRDGHPVGVMRLVTDAGEPPMVCSVFVEPAERGRGTATALLRAVQARALELGLGELTLWVVEGNDTAIALYERCGFVGSGRRQPVEPDDRSDDRLEIGMIWRPTSGDGTSRPVSRVL